MRKGSQSTIGSDNGKISVSTVLFDLDGTLFNTIPLILATNRHTCEKVLGWAPPDKEILATIGEPLMTALKRYSAEKSHELFREYVEWSAQRTTTHVGIFLDVIPMIERLRREGFKTGVVTSRRGESTITHLETFEMMHLFDVIVSVDDTEEHKPLPAPLLCAMERLGLDTPKHFLYVGDTIHDLECARNAGMYFAAVSWTAMDKDELNRAAPDFWLDNPFDLFCKVERIESE
ncbi:MAG TPA: HAD-IA family hydrolase [Clostridiaceae bacterium]|nr:HAD-IA family hydrolase [Clostridiaceae bacterium]